jgi:hypothetical protein
MSPDNPKRSKDRMDTRKPQDHLDALTEKEIALILTVTNLVLKQQAPSVKAVRNQYQNALKLLESDRRRPE